LEDRVIDLSGAAAKKLDMKKDGSAPVKIKTISTKK
jgi:rare lipoprotein A